MRAWRASMGYTQQQAAQALGVSLRTVKAWEAGFASPPAFLALACAARAVGPGHLLFAASMAASRVAPRSDPFA